MPRHPDRGLFRRRPDNPVLRVGRDVEVVAGAHLNCAVQAKVQRVMDVETVRRILGRKAGITQVVFTCFIEVVLEAYWLRE